MPCRVVCVRWGGLAVFVSSGAEMREGLLVLQGVGHHQLEL